MIGQKRTGSREGGIEVVVTELATRMAALGHEVTCYDRSGTDVNGNPAPTEPYEYEGVRVVPVKDGRCQGARRPHVRLRRHMRGAQGPP